MCPKMLPPVDRRHHQIGMMTKQWWNEVHYFKKKHVKNHWEAKSLDLDLDWERRFSSLDIGAHVNSIKKKTASSDEDGFLFSSFTQPDKVSYNVTDICQRSEFRVSIFQSCGGGSSQSTVQHRESCQNASQLDCECTFAKMPHS